LCVGTLVFDRAFLLLAPRVHSLHHSNGENDIRTPRKTRLESNITFLNSDLYRMNSPVRIGATMYILASILVLVMLTVLFSDAMDRQRNPNSAPTSFTTDDGAKSIILRRNRAGH
jgi:hypothetical protein